MLQDASIHNVVLLDGHEQGASLPYYQSESSYCLVLLHQFVEAIYCHDNILFAAATMKILLFGVLHALFFCRSKAARRLLGLPLRLRLPCLGSLTDHAATSKAAGELEEQREMTKPCALIEEAESNKIH